MIKYSASKENYLKAILEAGIAIPGEIKVIGAGNVHYSDLLRVPLSTIDQSSAFQLNTRCRRSRAPGPCQPAVRR